MVEGRNVDEQSIAGGGADETKATLIVPFDEFTGLSQRNPPNDRDWRAAASPGGPAPAVEIVARAL